MSYSIPLSLTPLELNYTHVFIKYFIEAIFIHMYMYIPHIYVYILLSRDSGLNVLLQEVEEYL